MPPDAEPAALGPAAAAATVAEEQELDLVRETLEKEPLRQTHPLQAVPLELGAAEPLSLHSDPGAGSAASGPHLLREAHPADALEALPADAREAGSLRLLPRSAV